MSMSLKRVGLLVFLWQAALCYLLENGAKVAHSRENFKDGINYARINASGETRVTGWESHAEALPLCDGRSLDELTSGGWYLTKEGHYTYEPDSCRLRRISGESARRCLSGKHIVFVGDSLTRYQYIAFAYYLSKMKRLEPYGGLPGYPSICIETEWLDWPQYYHFSSAILAAAAQGCGTELCDCLRHNNMSSLAHVREFRTLHLSFPDSCRAGHTSHSSKSDFLTVSYQQMFAHPDPQTAGQDALHHFELSYQHQPPDILVLNAGMHIMGVPAYNETLASILRAGTAVHKKHDTLLLWKSTTNGTTGPWMWRDEELQQAAAHGYAQYDVGRVALAAAQQHLHLTWDAIGHFLPLVYEQFNDVLLNYVCARFS